METVYVDIYICTIYFIHSLGDVHSLFNNYSLKLLKSEENSKQEDIDINLTP